MPDDNLSQNTSIQEKSLRPFSCFIVHSDRSHVDYIDVILDNIEKVLIDHNFEPRRLGDETRRLGDEIRSGENYLKKLDEMVDGCHLGVVILDGLRPNVLFELGYLLGKSKPTIWIQGNKAFINIQSLFFYKSEHSGLGEKNFSKLTNPPLDMNKHLSDCAGNHILFIDPLSPENIREKFKNEILKFIPEIENEVKKEIQEEQKEIPDSLLIDIGKLISSTIKVENSQENLESILENIEKNAKENSLKLPLIFYSIASSFYAKSEDYDKMLHYCELGAETWPTKSEAWYNWGNGLAKIGLEKKDVKRLSLAIRKYKESIKLDPSYYNALGNWGNSLWNIGMWKQNIKLIEMAIDKHREAKKIKPDDYVVLNNLGAALAELGRSKYDKGLLNEAEVVLNEAIENFKESIDIKSDFYHSHYNMGNALAWLGHLKEDLSLLKEFSELLKEALKHYEFAQSINSSDYYIWNNWGSVLSEIGYNEKDEKIFELAFDKFQKAIDINSNKYEAWNNWGSSLLNLALISEGKKRYAFFDDAEKKFLEAEKIKLGFGSYNLACLYAMKGDIDKAILWLTKAFEAMKYPPKDHIYSDPGLAAIRSDSRFVALIHKYFPEN
ncbi:MAG: hypothetical protein M1269_13365 [Chloroflexi bacterium]|nr:hypothetical protein [Chloroflexota bacterium]